MENMSVLSRGRGYGENVTMEGRHEAVWEVMKLLCFLIVVVVVQIYTCIKLHKIHKYFSKEKFYCKYF